MESIAYRKVSVIVPVYKVEDVLVRCLDSLCNQSLRDIEIILVDDASPDRCGEICEQYAAIDRRIKVFHHHENRGLSAARNTGIAHVSADYLMFVDSDDWVHKDFCRLPYECAVQHQVDLVMFDSQYIDKNGMSRPVKKAKGQRPGKLTRLEAMELMFRRAGVAAWNKLYNRKLFDTVSYPAGYFYEDTGTTYKTVLQANAVYYLDKILHYHCYHKGSITTLKTEKVLRDHFEMSLRQYRDLTAWGYSADELDLLLHNTALNYYISVKSDASNEDNIFYRKILRSEKQIPKGFSWRRKVLFALLKYCPSLFDTVCILGGKRL